MGPVTIIEADLSTKEHQHAVVELVNLYASDRMGIAATLPDETGRDLVAGLCACPTSVLYLAVLDEQSIGLAVCFIGFSTFAAKPLLNIHDLMVHPAYRRQGVASQMLAHIERDAQQRGCCKVTLEVRRDNLAAQGLYHNLGFGPGATPYEFWTKTLDGPGESR